MEIDPAWLDTDFYEVLGVDRDASAGEVTKAYRRLARQLHPDTNPDPAAEERFKAVSTAYDVLRDADKRSAYDQARRGARTGARRRPGGGYTIRVENLGHGAHGDDFGFGFGDRPRGSIFDDLFRSGPRQRGDGRRTGPRPKPGAAVRAEVPLPLADAVTGTTTTVAAPGQEPVTVRVPSGVEDGQTIRVAGKGAPGSHGGPAGDLLVTVHVRPHHLFGREGDDLTLAVPVTYAEAALGADVSIPTLEGEPVTVRIPAGTPSGRTLRVPGRGVPTRTGRGDLLVTVHVDVPSRLSDDQRELITRLARYDAGDLRDHLQA